MRLLSGMLALALAVPAAHAQATQEPVAFSAENITVREGDGELIEGAFVITLSHEVEHATATVRLQTFDRRVSATTMTYDLHPGVRQLVFPFSVRGDQLVDGDGHSFLDMVATGVGYIRSSGMLTVVDDDAAPVRTLPLLIPRGYRQDARVIFGHALDQPVVAKVSAPAAIEVPSQITVAAGTRSFVIPVKGVAPGAYDITITLPPELFSRTLTQRVVVGEGRFVWPDRVTLRAGTQTFVYVVGMPDGGPEVRAATVRDLNVATADFHFEPLIPSPPGDVFVPVIPGSYDTIFTLRAKNPGTTTLTVAFTDGRTVDVPVEVTPAEPRPRPSRH